MYIELADEMVPKALRAKVTTWRRNGERVPLTNTESKLLLKHNVSIDARGCWIWTLWDHGGYGRLPRRMMRAMGMASVLAHVAAYTLWNGPLPDGSFACHNCPGGDNKRCCNPAHLWVGTPSDNALDAVKKGTWADSSGANNSMYGMRGRLAPSYGCAVPDERRVRISKSITAWHAKRRKEKHARFSS